MAVVFVNARRASVAMVDEHQNAQLLTSRAALWARAHCHVRVGRDFPSESDQQTLFTSLSPSIEVHHHSDESASQYLLFQIKAR
jgi:hypothetical protein